MAEQHAPPHSTSSPNGSVDKNLTRSLPDDHPDGTSAKTVSGSSQSTGAGLVQRCTDGALHFLAHASNETLGACLVGLGASTYLVLGRIGLLAIGVAGGVVLHATWEGIRHDDRSEDIKTEEQESRRQVGIEVMNRVLQWRASKRHDDSDEPEQYTKIFAAQDLNFSTFEPKTQTALNTFTEAVVTDYVKYWYSPTVPDEETFPAQCRRVLTAFILSISGHLQRKRPADAFLDFVTNASSIIVVFLNELAVALNASPNTPVDEAVNIYLERKPDSSLAQILDPKYQDRKLAVVAEDILEVYLDPKSFNCPPVYTFLKEILAQLVLGYTITLCSAPDWINDYIIYGLEESATTKEVMDIVGAGVEGKDSPVETQVRSASVTDNAAAAAVTETVEDTEMPQGPDLQTERRFSQAEDAMDEAMKEARRLTQLMIEEDERKAREAQERQSTSASTEDVSEGVATPPSSDGELDRRADRSSLAFSEASSALTSEQADDNLPKTPISGQFTSFDQILQDNRPTALATSPESKRDTPVLTLFKANMAIFDDSVPGEKSSIKAKPTTDYLIQVEPASGAFAGWMVARKYADFEMLHEVLRRISVITGSKFTEGHGDLPKWKLHTKNSLRQELERYLTDAVRFQPLADSEGMKRFFERDQALLKGPNKGLGWPTPEAFGKLGGDVINVLAKAPKDVAGGGKALFGGLKSSKKNQSQSSISRPNVTPSTESRKSMQFADAGHAVSDSKRSSDSNDATTTRTPLEDSVTLARSSVEVSATHDARPDGLHRTESHTSQAPRTSIEVPSDSVTGIANTIDLPPPPSEIPDDYDGSFPASRQSRDTLDKGKVLAASDATDLPTKPPRPAKPPITEKETSVAIELMFAVVTELYTLSSAWQFRRTLLAAAKSFLLRPGNPQLLMIKDLLQKDLLDANLSDEGLAAQVYKLRENALPTAEEMEIWRRDYPEKTAEQKEEARIKARKLLVSKGMPAALTSVMGAAASSEALGRVFDCLQIPQISRGLVFGLMLQALKVVTQ